MLNKFILYTGWIYLIIDWIMKQKWINEIVNSHFVYIQHYIKIQAIFK